MPLVLHAQQSMYSDVKAHEVGDIITVRLMEDISGSSSTDSRSRGARNGQASSSMSGNFIPFEPYFGAEASVDYQADERNTANQQQLLTGTLSVRIQNVLPTGELAVTGSRSTEINGEKHIMELRGLVRPSDVNTRNQVPSFRVADADITYRMKEAPGQLFHKRGFVRTLIFGAVGLAAGTAAAVYAF